ncbi:(d)CMP kinase [Aeromicrobium sp. P5_D10]
MSKPLVVAIDGPSGSGKSSTSRGVATQLGLAYLDTGAMYRAMTWALLERGADLDDAPAMAQAAAQVKLGWTTDAADPAIFADDVDVSEPIRSVQVTSAVSKVAAVAEIRAQLVELQRAAIDGSDGIVVEGRDIGSVVAPDAQVKIYLVADPAARAERRAAETGDVDTAAMQAALARRDQIDSTRAASPLSMPDDAVLVDGTHLTLDEVIAHIVGIVAASR